MRRHERRRRRSDNTTRALSYQLEACRTEARLEGMVLSDEEGVCMARSGDGGTCDEVAARLPLIGRKTEAFEGVLLSAGRGWEVAVRRFRVEGGELYLAAIGGRPSEREAQLGRSEAGVSRILAS